MGNSFFCKVPCLNIYEQASRSSKISSQLLYGEKFRIIKNKKNFYKIKTNFDNYIGYIRSSKLIDNFEATHKVSALKSRIFKKPYNSKKFETKNYLPFSSNIEIIKKQNDYVMFENNKWIKSKDIVKKIKVEKNIKRILKLFLNCKYKWGGKTFEGIDCSALLQIFYKYNNKFFPRDTIDQIKYKKVSIIKKKFKKGDIVFWKGHVAVCIDSKKLIHAYGPEKKVIIMPIHKTIKRIERTAKLKVKKVFRI